MVIVWELRRGSRISPYDGKALSGVVRQTSLRGTDGDDSNTTSKLIRPGGVLEPSDLQQGPDPQSQRKTPRGACKDLAPPSRDKASAASLHASDGLVRQTFRDRR